MKLYIIPAQPLSQDFKVILIVVVREKTGVAIITALYDMGWNAWYVKTRFSTFIWGQSKNSVSNSLFIQSFYSDPIYLFRKILDSGYDHAERCGQVHLECKNAVFLAYF
jgi:hypothetical protein